MFVMYLVGEILISSPTSFHQEIFEGHFPKGSENLINHFFRYIDTNQDQYAWRALYKRVCFLRFPQGVCKFSSLVLQVGELG